MKQTKIEKIKEALLNGAAVDTNKDCLLYQVRLTQHLMKDLSPSTHEEQ